MSSEDCPGLTAYVGECDSRCADRCVAQHKQDYLGSWCWTNLYGTSYCMCCIVAPPDDDGYYWPPTTVSPVPAKSPQASQGVEPVASQTPLVSGVESAAPPQSPPTYSGIEPTMVSHTPPPCSPNVEYVAPQAHLIPPSAEPIAPTPQTLHSIGVKPAETPQTPRHSRKGKKYRHHHSKVIHH
ncbi:hypothetical protein C5167_019142 [Papaver somniferum]|uniref:Uncharacterized protein n=2 Tax=Papaver somniferum TaxID=3469 RepID=A0A4Y7ISN4_PAPSO|nr:hypothetical protein C5167_019142 [Papaver somniferum]